MSTLHRRLTGTPYGYSGTRLEDLGASEYTLVGICADQCHIHDVFFYTRRDKLFRKQRTHADNMPGCVHQIDQLVTIGVHFPSGPSTLQPT